MSREQVAIPLLALVLTAPGWLLVPSVAHAQQAASVPTSATPASTSTAAPAGVVKVVKGDVRVSHQGQESAASVGLRLYAGDQIQTGAAAAVGFTLRDDTLMSLGPASRFTLETFRYDESAGEGNVAVRLAKGSLRYVSGLIGKHAPQSQQVATPTATIGIRGTDFIVEVDGE